MTTGFYFFGPHSKASGILTPQPEIEPAPPAVEAQSLNHWTTRDVPPQLALRACVSLLGLP